MGAEPIQGAVLLVHVKAAREVHVSLCCVCSLASDWSAVSFIGGLQTEQRGNTLTFSSKIYSDLIITAAVTLHTETQKESKRRRAVKCHTLTLIVFPL